ncbi:hypothetical protein [Haladaptatus salinisoli]|uniref:hypothetical protein n=1 Tax=Haladaptatus salinisoli TaxID=2884876 RepID=UPI001D0AA3A3|nr:hypothetical protein [Haladaptatus salinisoli]
MTFNQIQKRFPTKVSDLRMAARTARLVLSIPQYTICFVVSAFLGLSVFVLSQNLELVQTTLFGGYLTIKQQIIVFSQLYPIIGTAFTPIKEIFLLLSAGLFGINFSMVVYYFREHSANLQSGTSSAVGVIFGTLGAGCAACGSVVLTGLLSFVGATSVLTLLPFDGLSFSAFALVVFLLSIYWLSAGMRTSKINGCPVDI